MKKEAVQKDFQHLSTGMTQRCIDNSRKCTGCRQLENLKSNQVFGLWSTPISHLKPVRLHTIVQDVYRCSRNSQSLLRGNRVLLSRWYESRVVFGSLCVEATRRGISVLTVIEADDGTTCIVHVFNAVSTGCRQEEVRKMFPKGIRVAISRPSIGTLHPNISPVILYVQSPENLNFASVLLQTMAMASSVGPHALRLEGNRVFTQGNYLLAAQLYTDCMGSIDERTRDVEMKKELVLAISNRAEAWIKLSLYEKAIADANRAIFIDPLHAKSFFRKGRALMAIHEHLDARGSLKLAAKNSDGEARKEFMEALAKCKIFVRQSQKGDFELGEYVSSGCNMENAPKCSDYVGPVEIRFTRDGRGRGLFVTKKVRLGELLLVSNSIALTSETSKEGPLSDYSELFVETLKACRSSRRIAQRLYAIQDESSIPNMKLFKPNIGYEEPGDDEEELDLNKIQKGVKMGYFPWSMLGQLENKRGRVWGLPAFINHSCLPNVSRLEVGKATFIHAARDLQAGEEMVMSYVDPFSSWNGERRNSIKEWGFECGCKRCSLEKSCQPLLRDVPRLDLLQGKIIDSYSQLLQKIESRLASSSMSPEERDLIRVTLFDFYGPFCVSPSEKLGWLKKSMSPEKLIRLLHLTAPGHPKTLVYMSYLAKFGENTSDVYQLLMDEFTAAYGLQCACLAWKVLKSYSEGALENFMEATFGNVRVCKCWFADDEGFRVECLF